MKFFSIRPLEALTNGTTHVEFRIPAWTNGNMVISY